MSVFKTFLGIFTFLMMLREPQMIYDAAVFALETWWNSVLPALLPFFIVSEFLMAAGLMNCLALWLEPIMRPLFRLSGGSALAIVMGFVSGTPTAANITATLYQQQLCSKDEAERLLAFTNNAGPLYILAAVAVGIFQNPAVGTLLFLSHYPINLLFGLLLRFFAKDRCRPHTESVPRLFTAGLQQLFAKSVPPLGSLLILVIQKALRNIGIVGGFMMVFGILTAAFDIAGITGLLAHLLSPFASLFAIDPACLTALAAGFWEMTIGIAVLPQANADLLSMLLATSAILAWHGISIQSQVAAMVADTDLSLTKYRICRLLHSFLAPLTILLLYKKTAPVFAAVKTGAVSSFSFLSPVFLLLCSLSILLLMACIGILIAKK